MAMMSASSFSSTKSFAKKRPKSLGFFSSTFASRESPRLKKKKPQSSSESLPRI
jgi:hypothetical protein